MVVLSTEGVALLTVAAEGVFVLVAGGVCEGVGTGLEAGDGVSAQLLKTRLQRKIQERIRILLVLAYQATLRFAFA